MEGTENFNSLWGYKKIVFDIIFVYFILQLGMVIFAQSTYSLVALGSVYLGFIACAYLFYKIGKRVKIAKKNGENRNISKAVVLVVLPTLLITFLINLLYMSNPSSELRLSQLIAAFIWGFVMQAGVGTIISYISERFI